MFRLLMCYHKYYTLVGAPTAVPTYTSKNPDQAPDVLRSTGLQYVGILKKLSDNPEFRHIVKNYYESHVGDTLFDYTVRLSELRSSSPTEFDNVLRESLTTEEYNFVMNTIGGFSYGGTIYYPTLFNFHYAPEFREIAEWDGDGITEVVFNYDIGGKFYGYKLDGSVVEYTDIDGRLLNSGKWVFEWGRDNLWGGFNARLYGCTCWDTDTDCEGRYECLASNGQGFCGLGTKKGGGCLGICPKEPGEPCNGSY